MKSTILKYIAVVAITILATLGVTSCKKEENTNVPKNQTKLKGIFVSGYETNTAGKKVAKYWKDGVGFNLTDGAKDAYAKAIGNIGNDLYVVGFEDGATGKRIVKYWKNNIEYNLTDGTIDATAWAIFISGNDLYISGSYGNKAVYWKNGTMISLTDGTKFSQASSIFVSGNDVYASGFQSYDNNLVATYWKNGTPTFLFPINITGNKVSIAKNIIVYGNDVYVATYDNFNTNNYAIKVWKNAIATTLSSGAILSDLGGMAISGSSVYITSTENNYASITNAYDSHDSYDVGDGIKMSYSTSIHFIGDERYITGYSFTNVGKNIATYWTKNRSAISLTDGTKDAEATDIIEVK